MQNWPPVMCPHCHGMRFITYEWLAQCSYCGFIVQRRKKNAAS